MNIIVLLYVAVILLGVFFIALAVFQVLKAKKARESWPITQGYVLTSDLKTIRSRRNNRTTTTYQPQVTYQYQVNNEAYTTNRIGFGNSTYSRGKAEKILEPYVEGEPVMVHYNPAHPSKAVLETRAANFWNFLFLGIVLVIAGIVFAVVL